VAGSNRACIDVLNSRGFDRKWYVEIERGVGRPIELDGTHRELGRMAGRKAQRDLVIGGMVEDGDIVSDGGGAVQLVELPLELNLLLIIVGPDEIDVLLEGDGDPGGQG
jgi:hypothetical protein